MRKKRVILWAVVLAVVVVAAGLYPVISKQMKTPRVTWYLKAPTGAWIHAVSPNGRFFVSTDLSRTYLAKEGDSKWTELAVRFEPKSILVSDLGTVLIQKPPQTDNNLLEDWYWFRAGNDGVHIDPKTSPSPKEFLEETDDWVALCDDSKEKVCVFDLSGSLLRPLVSPVAMKVGLNGKSKEKWHHLVINNLHPGFWVSTSVGSPTKRIFARIGTTFEERKVPPNLFIGAVASHDGRWFSVNAGFNSGITIYKDGVLQKKRSFVKPPGSSGLDALREFFDQYIFRKTPIKFFDLDTITGFDLDGGRRIGFATVQYVGHDYIQDGQDRFYASDLGLPSEVVNRDFPSFYYMSKDGRRIIGFDLARGGSYVFGLDR